MKKVNQEFIKNPIQFIAQYVINNMDNSLGNQQPQGYFDLIQEDQTQGFFSLFEKKKEPVQTILKRSFIRDDNAIGAYWCPYVGARTGVGYVDIPKHNPIHLFVFTTGMNGCSLVTTESPIDSNMFRVYHNQHPDSELAIEGSPNFIIKNSNKPVLSSVDFSDYGIKLQNENEIKDKETFFWPANGFNFLYYTDNEWFYVIQPQLHQLPTGLLKLNTSLTFQVRPISGINTEANQENTGKVFSITAPAQENKIVHTVFKKKDNLASLDFFKLWINRTASHEGGVCAAACALWLYRIKHVSLDDASELKPEDCDSLQYLTERDVNTWMPQFHMSHFLNSTNIEVYYDEFNGEDAFEDPNTQNWSIESINNLTEGKALYLAVSKMKNHTDRNNTISHAMAIYRKNSDTLYFFDPNKGICLGNAQLIYNYIDTEWQSIDSVQLVEL